LKARSIRKANGTARRTLLGPTLDALAQLRFEQERWKEAEELECQGIDFAAGPAVSASLCLDRLPASGVLFGPDTPHGS
jgi:hypothetical protein